MCMDVHADLWRQPMGTNYGGLSSAVSYAAVDEGGDDT